MNLSDYCEKCLVVLDFFQKEDNEKLEEEISDKSLEFIGMMTVNETTNLAELSVIKAMLNRERIHYHARDENLQSLFAAGLLGDLIR